MCVYFANNIYKLLYIINSPYKFRFLYTITIWLYKLLKGPRCLGNAGKIDELGRLIRDSAHCRIALPGDKLGFNVSKVKDVCLFVQKLKARQAFGTALF